MNEATHFKALENMYAAAPINEIYKPSMAVSEGKLKAVGKVVNKNKTQFIAESIVYDSGGIEIGRGNGVCVRSKMLLSQAKGYGT